MSVIEIVEREEPASFNQRWSHSFVLIFGVIGFLIGINLRESALNATTLYTNLQAGISAEYPQNWLIDEAGDYVFRVRDTSRIGYPTTIQVATRPVSPSTSARSILDALTLNRAQVLDGYNVLAEFDYLLPDDIEASAMIYTFVATNPNPFLQGVPVVIQGQDILTIQRGQAIIITFLSEAQTYEENLNQLNQFISTLEF